MKYCIVMHNGEDSTVNPGGTAQGSTEQPQLELVRTREGLVFVDTSDNISALEQVLKRAGVDLVISEAVPEAAKQTPEPESEVAGRTLTREDFYEADAALGLRRIAISTAYNTLRRAGRASDPRLQRLVSGEGISEAALIAAFETGILPNLHRVGKTGLNIARMFALQRPKDPDLGHSDTDSQE